MKHNYPVTTKLFMLFLEKSHLNQQSLTAIASPLIFQTCIVSLKGFWKDYFGEDLRAVTFSFASLSIFYSH